MARYAPSVRWDQQVHGYFEHAFGPEKLHQISQRLCMPTLRPTLRVNNLRISTEDALLALQQALPATAQLPYTHPLVPGVLVVPGTGPAEALDYSACASKEIIVNRLAGEAVLKGADIFAPGVLACSKGLVPGDLVAVTIAMPGSSPTYSAQTSSTQHDQPGLGQGPGTKAKSSRAARAPFVLNRGCTISEQNAHLLPERTHLHLGVGMAMMSRKEMFRASSGLAIAMQHRVFQVPPCNGLLRGQAMLQALPSIVAALALAPAPGSRVLDMCSAPGGKTTALAQLMGNQGEVVALDRTEAKVCGDHDHVVSSGPCSVGSQTSCVMMAAHGVRQAHADATGHMVAQVAEVWSLAADLGITCITAVKLDATRCLVEQQQEDQQAARQQAGSAQTAGAGAGAGQTASAEPSSHHQAEYTQQDGAAGHYSQGLQPGSFDYVLLDPPCSALGLRPRLLHDISLPQLRKVASYQRAMIHNAVALLKPGGQLVYCTCTINPGENEGNVNYISSRFPQMRLVEQPLHVAQPGLVPRSSSASSSEAAELWLSPHEAQLVQRFCPADAELDTMGFFIAKFVKQG